MKWAYEKLQSTMLVAVGLNHTRLLMTHACSSMLRHLMWQSDKAFPSSANIIAEDDPAMMFRQRGTPPASSAWWLSVIPTAVLQHPCPGLMQHPAWTGHLLTWQKAGTASGLQEQR